MIAELLNIARGHNASDACFSSAKSSALIEESTDIMQLRDGLPVTALDGSEIERAYMALCSVLVEVHEALELACRPARSRDPSPLYR